MDIETLTACLHFPKLCFTIYRLWDLAIPGALTMRYLEGWKLPQERSLVTSRGINDLTIVGDSSRMNSYAIVTSRG